MKKFFGKWAAPIGGVVLSLALAGCSDDDPNPPEAVLPNLVDTAVDSGAFPTLVVALQTAGLVDVLADESQTYTVFAPTEEAFAELGEETLAELLANPEVLADILLYHVVPGAAVDSDAAIGLAGSEVEMANEDSVTLSLREGELFVNDSQVVDTDIVASNGVIHVIDAVLIPPADEPGTIAEVAAAAGLTTLVAALEATDLDEVLSDTSRQFTVFAPSEAAFAELGEATLTMLLDDPETLSNILLFHVLADQVVDADAATALAGSMVGMANGDSATITLVDGDLLIEDAVVEMPNIPASNGIIHLIDGVILPPAM